MGKTRKFWRLPSEVISASAKPSESDSFPSTGPKSRHFAYSFENLKHPDAGHLARRQEFAPTWHSEIRNPTSGRQKDPGGSSEGDARSTIGSIPKVLKFLRKNLTKQQCDVHCLQPLSPCAPTLEVLRSRLPAAT